jgi:hypothetical protein
MSFVGYDYVKQRGMSPEVNGAVLEGMSDGL